MSEPRSAHTGLSSFLAMNELYFEAFAERDSVRRSGLLARCMTEDGGIWGPNQLLSGYAAISEKISAFHRNWPECRLVMARGIVSFDRFVHFAVAIARPDQSIVATGENVD